jgi:hypothetical protein
VQHSCGNLECELKQILLEVFEKLRDDVGSRRTVCDQVKINNEPEFVLKGHWTRSMNEKLDSFI